jgi:4-hydroxybutyryl-CoA dehydratase/vinylacetyl-CoA-Delta-isomerase
MEHPEVGPLLDEYLRGRADRPTENRVRALRLIENLTLGRDAVGYLAEARHGAGSPQAQRIVMARLADPEEQKELVGRLAGIETFTPGP